MLDNVVVDKSKQFALDIIRLYRKLSDAKCPRELSSQILRSGTSIGANIREGLVGQSTADFIARFNISLKEAKETEYWLDLLHEAGYIPNAHYEYIYPKNQELIKLLVSIIKKANENKNN